MMIQIALHVTLGILAFLGFVFLFTCSVFIIAGVPVVDIWLRTGERYKRRGNAYITVGLAGLITILDRNRSRARYLPPGALSSRSDGRTSDDEAFALLREVTTKHGLRLAKVVTGEGKTGSFYRLLKEAGCRTITIRRALQTESPRVAWALSDANELRENLPFVWECLTQGSLVIAGLPYRPYFHYTIHIDGRGVKYFYLQRPYHVEANRYAFWISAEGMAKGLKQRLGRRLEDDFSRLLNESTVLVSGRDSQVHAAIRSPLSTRLPEDWVRILS